MTRLVVIFAGCAAIWAGAVFGYLAVLPSMWAILVLVGAVAAELGWIGLCAEVLLRD